jgi:hypothetical protein
MVNQKLTERSYLSNSDGNDILHIVRNSYSYKQKISTLVDDKIIGLSSGYRGFLAIADIPTEDGYYYASESGTYTNAGGLVVSLTNTLTIINVSGTQTVFSKVEIPIGSLGYHLVPDIATFNSLVSGATSGVWMILDDITLTTNTTIPAGVTLLFNGGSIDLSTYTLTGDDTIVDANANQIFTTTGTFAGTFDFTNLYPEMFGAVGDAVNDDYLACQRAIDLATNPIIWNNQYYCSSNLKINKTNTKIIQMRLKDCALVIDATANNVNNIFIKGLRVTRDVLSTGTYGVILDADAAYFIRNCSITECYFDNLDKAIYSPPTGNAFHNRGTIIINKNFMQDCNYATYFDVETSLKDSNCVNDIHINNNIVYSLITDFYFRSADGCLIDSNTCFATGGSKKHSLHILDGLTDQVKISNNQFFENHEEAILIGNAKQFQINDNNIVRTLTPLYVKSGIKVTITAIPSPSVVSNNVIRTASKHGIELLGTGLSVYSINCNGNTIYCLDSGTVDGTDLATIDHYGVYAEGQFLYVIGKNIALSSNNVEIASINNTTGQLLQENSSKVPNYRTFKKTINLDAATKELFTTSSSVSSLLIFVQAYYSTSNNASYLLMLGTNSGGEEIDVVYENGLVGTTAPDTHPSFNFSLSGGVLSFAHKFGGVTGLDYSFNVIVIGDSLVNI